MPSRPTLLALLLIGAPPLSACGDPIIVDPPSTTEGGSDPSEGPTGSTADGGSGGTTGPGETSDAAVCGDSVVDAGEDCDDGNLVDDDGCQSDCTITPECGDGVAEGDEECDDGNEIDNDACTNACTIQEGPVCGDGVIEDEEKCDDGNNEPGDGCEPDCVPSEPGVCGDGVLGFGELCDDGNDVNSDGCQNDCTPTPDELCQPLPENREPDPYAPCDGALDPADPLAPFQAMELGCSDLVNQATLIHDATMNAADADAWRIAKGFGTHELMGELLYSPRKGESFLMLSTGLIEEPDDQGVVTEVMGSQTSNNENQNDDAQQLPPPISPHKGSNGGLGGDPFNDCDGADDCSDTLDAQWFDIAQGEIADRMWLSFKATPPELTESYSLQLVFCTSEYDLVNTKYNDLFIIWQVNERYTGNVSFINNKTLTVTSLAPYLVSDGYVKNDPALAGTGFEGQACSDWLTVRQNVSAGDPLEVVFFIADAIDQIQATVAILDDFRWRCDACTPGGEQSCAVDVPPAGCCGVAAE